MKGLTPSQNDRVINACAQGGRVLNSTIWSSRILTQNYYQKRGFSNSQILDMLKEARDINGVKDYVITINLEGFMSWSSTVGYTNVYGVKTFINRRFLDKFDDAEIFGHLMHEYCHRLGFIHKAFPNKRQSVPYLVGYASRDAFREYFKKPSYAIIPLTETPRHKFMLLPPHKAA